MNHRSLLFVLIALCMLAVLPAAAQTTSDEFTVVALPDTQFYSKSFPQIFNAETTWIAQNAHSMNIRLVIGLGDVVDGGGDLIQWQNADSSYRVLNGIVPYVVAQGNHDFDHNDVYGRTASSHNFNTFFGPSRYAGKSWYHSNFPAGSNENFYSVFTFGGRTYLVLVLEPFPRDSSLSWAHAVMKRNPDKDVIVVTHAYTYADSTRMNRCDTDSSKSFGVGQDNDGEQIWQKFASKYKNIVMVLSGHVVVGDGTGHRSDIGVNGNLVNQMLSDYQSWPNGGNGLIRLITIKPSKNQVVVRTYSPYLNLWLTDPHNQFTLPYKRSGIAPASGALTGKIKNVSNCAPVAGVKVSNGTSSAITDANGMFTLAAGGPAAYYLKFSTAGMATMPNSVSVVPAEFSQGKIFMGNSGSIHGGVTVAGAPVAAGTVVGISGGVLRAAATIKTAADGTFKATVPYGTYTLTVNVPGHAAKSAVVTVNTGTTVQTQLAVQ